MHSTSKYQFFCTVLLLLYLHTPNAFSDGISSRRELDQAAQLPTILAVNDLPVVLDEVMESSEDLVLDISPALLLANDSTVDTASNGQVLTVSAVSGAQHGAVILLANGTIQFTPEQDYFGPAQFTNTVSIRDGDMSRDANSWIAKSIKTHRSLFGGEHFSRQIRGEFSQCF